MTEREKTIRENVGKPVTPESALQAVADVKVLLQVINDERARMVALEEDLTGATGKVLHAHADAVVAGIREGFRLAHVED